MGKGCEDCFDSMEIINWDGGGEMVMVYGLCCKVERWKGFGFFPGMTERGCCLEGGVGGRGCLGMGMNGVDDIFD